jgi:hypothetical protein
MHFVQTVCREESNESGRKIEEILPSLRFIAENGSIKDKDAAKAVGSIFSQTQDSLAKDLCLSALRRIGNQVAQREMRRILNDGSVALRWRSVRPIFGYLAAAELENGRNRNVLRVSNQSLTVTLE